MALREIFVFSFHQAEACSKGYIFFCFLNVILSPQLKLIDWCLMPMLEVTAGWC